VKDPTALLRSATRRAKSDVANKLISMCLHELSRKISENWLVKVDDEEYGDLVRKWFNNECPYCLRPLDDSVSIVEHLDGMNRYRAGLHTPGNVLVACKKCNSEKRRDDALKHLLLATSGWESFLSHDGSRCPTACLTCRYWKSIWEDDAMRHLRLTENLQRIRSFRAAFADFERAFPAIKEKLPALLTKLYADCQVFAETEIKSLLEHIEESTTQT
jgi:hypothetical protein